MDPDKIAELLRRSQLVVENSHDAIISETVEGVIMSWNGGATKMLGYSAEEVVGTSALFLLPPEGKDEFLTLLNKIKAGEVVADYDSVRLRKDGTRIEVALSASPIKMDDGGVVGVSIVERDITERKKAEEVLRQIQLIVENSQDGIFGTSLEGTILSWNGGAKKMFGYSASEVIGTSSMILLSSEKKEELQIFIDKIKHKESILNYDTIVLRKDGSKVDVLLSISPILAGNENVIGASVVVRDITERKKSEQHIKELNEVRSKFITIISHQLRTPLTAVNWNIESLLNGDFGKLEEIQHKFLQATHLASVEITNRINNLLTAIDIEEGRTRYDTEEVCLNSLCAGVVLEMQSKSELKNISCLYTPPPK